MNSPATRYAGIAMLLALATIIHSVEAMLPVTVLWLRFGFANIIGVTALYLYGFKTAVFVTLGRILLGSMLTGQLGSPGFVLSFAGGVAAILVMESAKRMGSGFFSPVGVSILGAAAHNMGQLAAAYALIIRNEAALFLAPVMLLSAAGTGLLNGLAASYLMDRVMGLPKIDTTGKQSGRGN
jgi:heptaprenyl diphosphate synthase